MANRAKKQPAASVPPVHTPWSAVEYYAESVSVVDADGFEIVDVKDTPILLDYEKKLGVSHWAHSHKASREIDPEEQARRARLIAAAPDLLAALEVALATMEATMHRSRSKQHPFAEMEQARAALAKARGGA